MKKLIQRCAISIAAIALLTGTHKAANAVVGATVPWTSLEAEAGTLGAGATVVGQQLAPDRYSNPTLEASGHSYVQLNQTGQYVQWTNNTGHSINAINIRACVPDTSGGGGQTYSLSMYVNGTFRQSVTLSSKQTWIYEGVNYQGNDQAPSQGKPHVFYDDMHTFISGAVVANGDTIRLEKDAADSASFYYIDVVDIESVAAALTQPAGSLSITDFGAVANSPGTNNYTSIQNCINACQSQGKTMWIPSGTFYFQNQGGLSANGITITGAGPWYSTIYRNTTLPFNSGGLGAIWNLTSCHVSNFANDSNATSRASTDGCGGAMDTTGTNWTADNIWTQHVMSGFWASGTGGTIQNCRLTSIWADGANINNVSLNNTVGNNITEKNNFVRGTGDDGIAINSVHDNGGPAFTPMANCSFLNNTVTCAWGGKDIAIYGGSGHLVQNNYAADTARYIGLGIGKFGTNGSDLLSATVTGNTVVRGGGNGFEQGQPAMHCGNGGDGQGVGIVQNVTITGNTIINSLYDGMGFSTSSGIDFETNTIQNPGRDGVIIQPPFYPAPSGSATLKFNTVTGLIPGRTQYHNNSGGYTVTENNNSWDSTGGGPEQPYGGTPWAIPGTVQNENYDTGGEGVGYHDSDTTNSGGQYRTDGVDVEGTSDGGTGFDVGFTNSGEWLKYTVNVASAGTYTVSFRVANGNTTSGTIHLMNASGTNLTGSVTVPATGGWQTWTTVNATVTLPAGQQVLELFEDTGGYNFNYMTFASSGNVAPSTPTLSGTAGNGSVSLSWTTSTGTPTPTYTLLRGTTPGGENTTVTSGLTSTSFSNTGLTNGQAYYYKVQAINVAGTATSNEVGPLTPQPSLPGSTTLSGSAGNTQVTLSWTTSSGATSYNIYQNGTLKTNTGNTNLSANVTGLTNGTSYNFTVAGVNSAGTGSQSNSVALTPTSGSTMVLGIACGNSAQSPYVADVDFSGGAVSSGTTTTISTAGVTNPAPQSVYQHARKGTCTYTIPGLTAGASYTVRLHFAEYAHTGTGQRQFNVSINGTQVLTNFDIFAAAGGEFKANVQQFSATANGSGQIVLVFTTVLDNVLINGIEIDSASGGGTAPPAPTGLTATAGNLQVALNWNAVSGATSYNILRSNSSNTETQLATSSTNSFTNTGLTNGTTYFYKVSAVNSFGTSGLSNEASGTPFGGVTGIDLIVTSISWTPTTLSSGAHVIFSCVVKNQGSVATPAGTIVGAQFAVDGVTTPITWSDTNTASLAAGASVTLTANSGTGGNNFWTAVSGSHTVQAWVDDVNRIAESNENNNKTTATVSVP